MRAGILIKGFPGCAIKFLYYAHQTIFNLNIISIHRRHDMRIYVYNLKGVVQEG